jgi:hypothetical protein
MASEEGGIGQAIFGAYNCNFVLPLSEQSPSSKNRVGALLAGVGKSTSGGPTCVLDVNQAKECVDSTSPLWEQLPAANFSYRADTEADLTASLSISTFNLTGLEAKYINEIIVNVTNATVSQAPDDFIGGAVAFWKGNAFYKTRNYTDVVVSNCAGIVDFKFYFDASLDAGKINFTVGQLSVALGLTLKVEQGQEANTSANPPTQRSYVRFTSMAMPATDSTPGSAAFPVVFGLVLANPADYE